MAITFGAFFHDVGQGDCTHIEVGDLDTTNLAIFLVDFGYKQRPFVGDHPPDHTLAVLVERIKFISEKRRLDFPYLDHLFLTHPDYDHWNYIDNLIAGTPSSGEKLWEKNGYPQGTQLKIGTLTFGGAARDYEKSNRAEIKERVWAAAENITSLGDRAHTPLNSKGEPEQYWSAIGEKLKIYLISSNVPSKGSSGNPNPKSLVLIFDFVGFKIMLTGDAEPSYIQDNLEEWYEENLGLLQCNILKLAHHGSRKGTTPEWVALVKPKIVTVSGDYFWAHPYYQAIKTAVDGGTVGKVAPKHWIASYHDDQGDYVNLLDTINVMSSLWYVVTSEQITADDSAGVSRTFNNGLYVGVSWLIQATEGIPELHFDRAPAVVWPGPDATPVG